LLGSLDASGVHPVGLAFGRPSVLGGEGGALLQRRMVEFERGGEADGVALAASDGPSGVGVSVTKLS
jgi:hypothetical protein